MNITKILTLLFAIIFMSNLSAQEIKAITEFRGIKWGTKIENGKLETNLNKIYNLQKTEGKIEVYTDPLDEKTIGVAKLKEVYYYFHKDAGLFKVIISGPTSGNQDIDAALKSRLGKDYAFVPNYINGHTIWRVGDVIVDFREQMSEDFTVTIKSDIIADYHAKKNKTITDF